MSCMSHNRLAAPDRTDTCDGTPAEAGWKRCRTADAVSVDG